MRLRSGARDAFHPRKTPRALFRERPESAVSLAGENGRHACSSMVENID
jgi:hypothetical protein